MNQITSTIGSFTFAWDCAKDAASFKNAGGSAFWNGKLLPSFALSVSGADCYTDCAFGSLSQITETSWRVSFTAGNFGGGDVICTVSDKGVSFTSLTVRWNDDTAIAAMYFGEKSLTDEQMSIASPGAAGDIEDVKSWESWRAHEYCVPCAGSSPTYSFWRFWDMGFTTLPLGSFGPSMGAPYAAAFPRPLYACAMGSTSAQGWVALGCGEIPDAAMSLKIKAGVGALEYLYRDDLWGAANSRERRWNAPFSIGVGENAYEAYAALFASLDVSKKEKAAHLRSFYCTWGQFVKGEFDLRRAADYATDEMKSDVLLIDATWESSSGSGQPNEELFPNFADDIQYAKDKGLAVGLWLPLGWIRHPEKFGLDDSDLLCGSDGKPRLSGWIQNPHSPPQSMHYCLDPASEKVREFLKARSRDVVSRYGADLLKLDFGYGLPDPNVSSSRDPSMRGEKLAHTLLKIIGDAAREVNPAISIIYYGISPLMSDAYDIVSIDDMGDCGDSPAYEKLGHTQRAMWASLAAAHGTAINASSGYFWDSFNDILLDTFVIGVPGTVLPQTDSLGKSITPAISARWSAAQKWCRRGESQWSPLFLDCDTGGRGSEPSVRSWARCENGGIYSCALRNESGSAISFDALKGIAFTGKWAVVSADDSGIYACKKLAVIPFSAGTIKFDDRFANVEIISDGGEIVSSKSADGKATLTAVG